MKIQTPIFNSPALPELLAPAGSKEKLEVAIEYGADAVYLAGLNYGLRTSAQNFTPVELQEGVALAHEKGVAPYLRSPAVSVAAPFIQALAGATVEALSRTGVAPFGPGCRAGWKACPRTCGQRAS